MSLTLTNSPPPPWMMPDSVKIVLVSNDVKRDVKCEGPTEATQEIEERVRTIHELLIQFKGLVLDGHLQIVILSDHYMLEGELTAYHVPTETPRDALVERIDQEVFCLRTLFGRFIRRIEFTLDQKLSP